MTEGCRAFDDSFILADSKPLYCAKRGDKEFIVHSTDEGHGYDKVFFLHVEGDEIVFGARKGRKLYRVSKKIA